MSNLNQIAKILKQTGGRFIIVEDGEPAGVLLSIDDYENLMKRKNAELSVARENEIEKVNEKIQAEKDDDISEDNIFDDAEESADEEEIYFEEVDPFDSKKVKQEEIIIF